MAVKTIRRSGIGAAQCGENPEVTNKYVLAEAETIELSKGHPHVVTLYGVCLDSPETVMLVTEYCDLGNLYQVVAQPALCRYAFFEILHLAKQGVSGLIHLHSLRIVHRDIEARNSLIDSLGIVKVCDFGLAKVKPKGFESCYASKDVNQLLCCSQEPSS